MTIEAPQAHQPTKTATQIAAIAESQKPWVLLSRVLQFQSPDHKLWWDRLAPVIGPTLEHTGYSRDAQYRNLLVIYSALVPSLGPFPNQTRSNLTWKGVLPNDSGPLEASVNYQQGPKAVFRIAIEPIGPHAGTEADPVNEFAAKQMLQRLCLIQPGVDFTWFDHLSPAIGIDGPEARKNWDSISHLPFKSHTTMGLDLNEGNFTAKSYLGPFVRSAITGKEGINIIFDGLRQLRDTNLLNLDWSAVEKYMLANREKLLVEKSYVSFDCKSPAQSRIKLYAEAHVTSLTEVYDYWTLGGHLQGTDIEKGFEIIEKMWKSLYHKELPNGKHREAMRVQLNWEMSPKDGSVVPKMYFLVRDDYDVHVSSAVVDLFEDLGWDEHIQTHKTIEKEA